MAKIIQHGKYWNEIHKKDYKEVLVQCPECGELIKMNSYDIYIDSDVEAWCNCGCRFIPEIADVINLEVNNGKSNKMQ